MIGIPFARALAATSLLGALAPPATVHAQACDFSAPVALAQGVVDDAIIVTGASFFFESGEGSIGVTEYLGDHDATTRFSIASASKLVSAVAILTLVDDGLLDLDAPVSTYLPQFTGMHGTMTVRQMFSHTSGLPGGSDHAVLSDDTITLAQAADQIAAMPLDAPPGTQFAYGGLSMHAAGRVAEVVTGQSWTTLFAERVAIPLGLTQTTYDAFGATPNPRVAGGVRSTLADYAKILRMIRDRGRVGATQFLSPTAMQTLTTDQTNGVPIVSTPAGDDRRYTFGAWLDLASPTGETLRTSSPGAWGFTPWVELDQHTAGIFMVLYLFGAVQDDVESMQALCRAQVESCLPHFRRGDVNGDSAFDLADPIRLLGHLFASDTPLDGCLDRADANDDGEIDIADAIRLLTTLFVAPIPIPDPGLDCNVDATPDAIVCPVSSCP